MIIWTIQSVTKSEKEIQMLIEMGERQRILKLYILLIRNLSIIMIL